MLRLRGQGGARRPGELALELTFSSLGACPSSIARLSWPGLELVCPVERASGFGDSGGACARWVARSLSVHVILAAETLLPVSRSVFCRFVGDRLIAQSLKCAPCAWRTVPTEHRKSWSAQEGSFASTIASRLPVPSGFCEVFARDCLTECESKLEVLGATLFAKAFWEAESIRNPDGLPSRGHRLSARLGGGPPLRLEKRKNAVPQ